MKTERLSEILTDLEATNGGVLQPDVVVNFARPSDSPLHKFFTWDDRQAGEELRLIQAKQLIKRVRIVRPIKQKDGSVQRVRVPQFYHVPAKENQPGGYYGVDTILTNRDLRLKALEKARGDLRSAERAVEDIEMLGGAAETIRPHLAAARAGIDQMIADERASL